MKNKKKQASLVRKSNWWPIWLPKLIGRFGFQDLTVQEVQDV